MKKILFICPYPLGLAPSQRFRFEQYLSQLEQKGFQTVIKPFFTEQTYSAFYQSGNLLSKIPAIVESYFNRLRLLLHLDQFDAIFIHREAAPVGPPIIEWVIAKVKRKKIIYDFDDAIWLTDKTNETLPVRAFRWRNKIGLICRWSSKVSCGNRYLADYAKQFNPHVVVNPTTIDTMNLHVQAVSPTMTREKVVIGWTGTHSTLKYLYKIVPVLQALEHQYPKIEFLIIADQKPDLPLNNAVFRPWKKETEITDLAMMDIGIMPLPDDPWTRGKCGFKALQYMSLGIPAVVSPVGVNAEIVHHGVEGYVCGSFQEWFDSLQKLILDPVKRMEMGTKGRQKVTASYSVSSNAANFLSLFQ